MNEHFILKPNLICIGLVFWLFPTFYNLFYKDWRTSYSNLQGLVYGPYQLRGSWQPGWREVIWNWVDIPRWLLDSSPCSDAPIVPNITACLSWLLNLVCGAVAVTSPEHLLETQNLCPTADLLTQNLCRNSISGWPKTTECEKQGMVGNDTTTSWNPLNYSSRLLMFAGFDFYIIIQIWLWGQAPLGPLCCLARLLGAQLSLSSAHSPVVFWCGVYHCCTCLFV